MVKDTVKQELRIGGLESVQKDGSTFRNKKREMSGCRGLPQKNHQI